MVRYFFKLHFALDTNVLLFLDVKTDIIVGILEKIHDY